MWIKKFINSIVLFNKKQNKLEKKRKKKKKKD